MANQSNCLLIITEQAGRYRQALEALNLPGLKIMATEDLAEARACCQECTILMGDPYQIRQILDDTPRLRWVQSNYAGVSPLLAPSSRRDYVLSNVGSLYSSSVSEYVFCYMLMLERQTWRRFQAQLEQQWDDRDISTLRGKTIGILGVGNNGCKIAETARYFGMRTRGMDRDNASCPFIDEFFPPDRLLEFVSDVNYLVCSLPETPQTTNLVNAMVLGMLPQSAVLINVGRGSAIDDLALAEVLCSGRIAGAVLDVLREEPLPPDHPFWSTPNLILTFHTAAPGPGFNPDIVELFADNYQRFISDQTLRFIVHWARGY